MMPKVVREIVIDIFIVRKTLKFLFITSRVIGYNQVEKSPIQTETACHMLHAAPIIVHKLTRRVQIHTNTFLININSNFIFPLRDNEAILIHNYRIHSRNM